MSKVYSIVPTIYWYIPNNYDKWSVACSTMNHLVKKRTEAKKFCHSPIEALAFGKTLGTFGYYNLL